MKNKFFAGSISLFGLLIAMTLVHPDLRAQDTLSRKSKFSKLLERRYVPFLDDTMSLYGKNELAFNMAPFVSTLLGGYPDNQFRISLFYKRRIHDSRNHFRAGLTFRPEIRNPFFYNPDELIFITGDSTRTRVTLSDNGIKPFQLNLGIERHSKHQKRLSGYIAADLIGGIYYRRFSLFDINERMNTDGDWEYSNDPQVAPIITNDSKVSINWYFGFSPNAGIRYAITRRLFLTAQIGFEAAYYNTVYYDISRWGDQLVSHRSNYFDFTTNALINEFNLAFRF